MVVEKIQETITKQDTIFNTKIVNLFSRRQGGNP